MKISSAALLAACLLLSGASAGLLPQKEGIQTLVLLDDWATIETHSVFFDSFRKDGHSLLFETANPPPPIKYYESYFYDNIILMAPAAKDLKSPIATKDLIEYLEANHNLMIFGETDAKKPVRTLVNEFGVEFENVGYELKDFSHETSDNTIYSRNFFEPFRTTSKGLFTTSNAIAFTGGVAQIVDHSNQYVFPILRAEQSTISFNTERNEASKVSGEAITLVSGYQTRGNQRVSVSGSLSMCSNDNMQLTIGSEGGLQSSANFQFCKELYQWTFQQRGVIKLSNMRHHKQEDQWSGVNPENYRIKDLVTFEVDFEEKRPDGTYAPFRAEDIQLEFIRLDPFHRLYLKQANPSSATYSAQLVVPDTLGIYKFKVSHRRYGYSLIEAETLVSCIQFRHDEYPRFLNVALPYYVNVFMIMGAGFLFIMFFLYSEIEKGVQSKKGQKE